MTDNQKNKSQKSNVIILTLSAFLIALVSFSTGVKVGLVKAKFSYHWGENYERNFTGPHFAPPGSKQGPTEFFRNLDRDDFRNAHGISGTIISISANNLVVKDKDGKENTVTVSEKTTLKKFRDNLTIVDLRPDDKIVVLGRPGENGTLEADLIRVFDK